MDLRLLEIFCHVYEERSFSRAAERLGLTQPTISGHIKALEDTFDTQLFDRLGRTIRPTPAGEVLYSNGQRIIEGKERTLEAMRRFLGRLEGRLRLGASTIPGEYLLPSLIGRFREAHPGIQVSLQIRDSQEILNGVLADDFELGLVGAALEDPAVEIRRFADDHLILIAPPTPGWLPNGEISIAALRSRPLLIRERGSGTRAALDLHLADRGLTVDDFDVVAELGSTAALKEAVKARLGAAFISERAVRDELEVGWVRRIEVEGVGAIERSFYSVIHRRRPSSPLRDAFLEHLGASSGAS